MPDLPPWLNVRPADFLQATEAGTQAGLQAQAQANQAAEAQARLTQEQYLAEQEIQMRKQILQQQMLRQNAQIENLRAYLQAQVGIAQDRLERQQAVDRAKAADQAKKFAAQQKFSSLLQSGMRPEQALSQVPELATPSAVAAMGRGSGTRDYGDIQSKEGPGGSTVMWRQGSPGFHVVPPKKDINERMFDIEMAALAKRKAELSFSPKQQALVDQQMEALRAKHEAKTSGTGTSTGGGSKVERARQLHKEHPDWDKTTIIEAVNKEFGVAPAQ